MQISTYKLAEIIAIETFLKDRSYSNEELNETIKYILEYVDIIGEDNHHLRNQLNLDESVCYFRKRETPLNGNELVTGDYLIFKYIGHNEDMFLIQYKSLEEIEENITNGAGITNIFTAYQVAIVNGRVRRYDIYFINEYDGLKYKFIKDVHDALPKYQSVFDKASVSSKPQYEITNISIEWK